MSDRYASKTLRQIIRVIAGRFPGMMIILILVVAAVAAVTYVAPKWYRSEVELRAKPGGLVNPLEYSPTSARDEVSLFVRTQRQIIMSDYVLASALMRLVERPAPQISPEATTEPWYGDEQIAEFVRDNGRLLREVRRRVSVVTPGGPDATFTQTFTVQVDWPEEPSEARRLGEKPEDLAARRAYEMARFVTEAYLMRHAQLESRSTKEAEQLLEQKALVAALSARDAAGQALEQFISQELKGDLLPVINMAGKGGGGIETGVASLARQFRSKITDIEEQLAEAVTLRKAIEVELDKQNVMDLVVPQQVLTTNPPIAKLNERIVLLKLQLNELTPRFTAEYQEIQHVKAELLEAYNDLRDQLVKQRTRLEQQIGVLRARRQILAETLQQDREVLDRLATKVATYQRLQNDFQMTQKIFEEEKKRVVSAATVAGLADKHVLVGVLDEPSQPSPADPRRPIWWLNIVVAAFGGLILAFSYAFLSDYFDHTIKSIDDAERYLGTPVLMSVPKLGGRIVRTR